MRLCTRLYILRKIRFFDVYSKMLVIFLWCAGRAQGDSDRLDELIGKTGSVIFYKIGSFEAVVEKRSPDKPDHPLHHLLDRQTDRFSSAATRSGT